MASRFDKDLTALRQELSGGVVTRDDSGYEAARSIWNGVIERRPAVIACCTSAADVAAAVRFARQSDLEIAIRGGGHNFAGHALCDGGLMIHLGQLNGVSVDPAARRATCGGGATWGDIDAVTQQYGLATPGGFVSHTGVAGLTLGGGIGWLTKKAGLSCDNLLSAEVVTADGRIVRASHDENADLFWALRGGGGNFGVVTSFEFALHEVGPTIQMGLFFFDPAEGQAALRFSRDFIKTLAEDTTGFLGIGLSAPPEPFVPPEHHLKPGHALVVIGFGSAGCHAEAVAPIRDAGRPLFELVTPMPFAALQQMFNGSAPWGALAYEKSLYLDSLSDDAIAVIDRHAVDHKSPLSFAPTFMLDGRYREVADEDTAFGGRRSAGIVFNLSAVAPEPERDVYEHDRAWVRRFWEAMRPHGSNTGGYVNFMTEAEDARVRTSYGAEKYARLARIKRDWDPDNVFHLNANIRPA